jgi:hypothetical protein
VTAFYGPLISSNLSYALIHSGVVVVSLTS